MIKTQLTKGVFANETNLPRHRRGRRMARALLQLPKLPGRIDIRIGEAARLGGRNIRTRSQTLVNHDLLIDLPPDTYYHKLMSGLDFSAVKYLFVTHWHMDHFYPQELTVRGSFYSHQMTSSDLDIYCAAGTKALFDQVSWEANKETLDSLRFHILSPFSPVQAGDYTVTPLPANHMHEVKNGQAVQLSD